ncbi:MAG: class I SAM-dependent methyltransferase [Candidatus Omnitrophica bacterium]|nr:class I SAM-dependent methyltransferase [Candidatus Omnitrophota bacterium]
MDRSSLIDKKIELNNAVWDDYYRGYQKASDMPGVRYPNEHLVRFINRISKKGSKKRKRILELGFGTIANMLMMQDCGYKVLGLEVSQDAVERARGAIKKKNLESSLSVDVFSGNRLPVEDESFDIIVGLQCVYYNIDQEVFAKECQRVLKLGGWIFFSFFSPRHGYMNYIDDQPGSVVKFKEDHPNPRLKGLELFLFKSKVQFEDIYGRYFDIEVGLEEFDLEPIFMSWQYLIGKKRPFTKPRINFTTAPFLQKPLRAKESNINKEVAQDKNRELWDRKYRLMYKDGVMPGNKYPNEHLIRFLATRRRPTNSFYVNIGKENEISGDGQKVLEIMPLNITNLMMALDMDYIPYGVSGSNIVIEETKKAAERLAKAESMHLDRFEKGRFPYKDKTFDVIISEKAGSYMPNQRDFIDETKRVLKSRGEIFIGYLSPRHGYLQWARPLGSSYYEITPLHPDPTMRGIMIYVPEKNILEELWGKYFDVEIKFAQYDLYKFFSSFYFVKARRKDADAK